MKTVIAAVAVLALAAGAQAQSYPTRPVRMVTEFLPGSGGDLLIRIVAGPMGELLGQPVIVENRAGAGGVIAAEAVIRATPDGYTFLAGTPHSTITRRFLARTQAFDVLRDLQPLTAVGETTTVVVAGPASPVKSYREALEYARQNPGKLTYGTSGVGSTHHLSQEQVNVLAGVSLVHVPYKGGLPAIQDVVSGQIPLSYSILSTGGSFIKAGKVRVIAVVSEKRYAGMSDVPSLGELVPGFQQVPSWTAFFAPTGLPEPVLRRLAGDAIKAITRPDTRAKLAGINFEPIANTPEEFATLLRQQIDVVARVVKAAGMKPIEP